MGCGCVRTEFGGVVMSCTSRDLDISMGNYVTEEFVKPVFLLDVWIKFYVGSVHAITEAFLEMAFTDFYFNPAGEC
jgi:hypothetical protein